MSERLLVFMDDVGLLPELSGGPDILIVSLDRQAASEVPVRPGVRIRDIAEYAERRFASYEELYDDVKAAIRERVEPKDPLLQSRFLFEALWDDILLELTPIHYIETLIREILAREAPARVGFAIADRRLDALFRGLVQHLS
jgi:hypothetical protein